MTIEQRFIAFDGKEFATETACQEYEMSFNDILPVIKKINKICKSQPVCKNCKFSNSEGFCLFRGGVPEYWKLEGFQLGIGE